MTARQGKWRVTVRNFSTMETGAVTNIYEFDSFDAALEYALLLGVASTALWQA